MKKEAGCNKHKVIRRILVIFGTAAAVVNIGLRKIHKKDAEDEELKKNVYEDAGKKAIEQGETVYERYVKRMVDVVVSTVGLVVLFPVFLLISVAIVIDDPGPVFFSQKRVGKNKVFFKLYKFRSMKMSTPHDVPTHMLENPEQYITHVGKFLRKTSLDELPQLYNILVNDIAIVGPRPALWNQEDLVQERDKYGANDVIPGLTGWAQINGRDELEIPVKAKFDGEYVDKLKKNSISGMIMDGRCFFGTIASVLKSDGVVEGGTGKMHKAENGHYDIPDVETQIGFDESVNIDLSVTKKVLVTGANSYIGESFATYAQENYGDNFAIKTVDMLDGSWRGEDFSGYDVVFHVAGLAHADVGNVSEEIKQKYYAVNTDLAIETAKKAKAEGVKQFVFMSSMIIYGESAPYGKKKVITAETKPEPANFYGDSKWQADKGVRALADNDFQVLVLRPPMIYGKGSKGNYPILAKLAKKLPVFPDVNNQRSMLYIENLCEFLCQVMLIGKGGIFFPQNSEYTRTSDMVAEISKVAGKKIKLIKLLNPAVWIGSKMPGKIGELVNKAFGNSCYAKELSQYEGLEYQKKGLEDSVMFTEGDDKTQKDDAKNVTNPKALMLASVASMIEQFNMQNIQLLLEHGYQVDVVCNCQNGNTISEERVSSFIKELNNKGVTVCHVPIPRKITDVKGITESLTQVKKMCNENQYDLLHCHSPIGSVIARLAARKARKHGTKVIYTAHGFHFYKGAPKRNWIIFYPIEKICSRWTDVLITINKEDFEFAQKHMRAGVVKYIPGVGVDTKQFRLDKFDKVEKRAKFGISEDDMVILSVGELNQNKNQEVIIRAMGKLNNPKLHYFIAGKGVKEQYLVLLAEELGVNLHLLGYRTDVVELLNAADIFALPSFREGLSVALMEAMAAGLPCVASDIRGNQDLIDMQEGDLCNPVDADAFADRIRILSTDSVLRDKIGKKNQQKVQEFDTSKILKIINEIYFA